MGLFGQRKGPRRRPTRPDPRFAPDPDDDVAGKTVIVTPGSRPGSAARAAAPARAATASTARASASSAASPARRRLMDLGADWFATVLAISRVPELPDPSALYLRAVDLKDRFESQAATESFRPDDVRDAVFALAAFFNETVLSSKGRAREVWLSQPLEVPGFDRSRAGETFFTLLDELRKNRDQRIEALEVFYACLLFGYVGRYRMSPPDRLAAVTQEVEQDIMAVRGSAVRALSPHAARPSERAGDTLDGEPAWTPWLWYGGAVLAAFLLVLIAQWLAAAMTAGAVRG